MRFRPFVFSSFVIGSAVVVATQGCGLGDSSEFGNGDNSDGGDNDSNIQCLSGDCNNKVDACLGLECQVNLGCADGHKTSVSGKVYDPSGRLPLYNVVVYVPTDVNTLPSITPGLSGCNLCDASISNVVAATITDESGSFKLENIPTGANIPLVMQVGKWRRKISIPATKDCDNIVLAAADTRLPRNKNEGDIPQMAVLTGGCDPLACMFRKIGLDASEFTNPQGAGRMHVYKGVGGGDVVGGGAGDCTASGAGCPLWNSKQALEKYDIVVLSCECDEHNETKPNMLPVHDYLNEGGKIFSTHFHYTWFKNGPADVASVANWGGGNSEAPFHVDTTFPKGQAFVTWLGNVGALAAGNTITLNNVKNSVSTVNAGAQRWIYSDPANSLPESDKYFTFNTPVGGNAPAPDAGADAGPTYCGRAVFSDIHMSTGDNASNVPKSCSAGVLTAQEKALAFLFFDLSACVSGDKDPVKPPIPR